MKYAIALAAALVLNATANLMLKFGVRRLGDHGLNAAAGWGPTAAAVLGNGVLIAGFVLFALNAALYAYALSGIRISLAYPIMVGGGFAIIALVAWRHLGETLTAGQWAGIALILAGVYLVARQMQAATG